MKRLIGIGLLGVIPFIGACGIVDMFSTEPRTEQEMMQDTVFTLGSNVQEGIPASEIAIVPRDQLPKEVVADLPENESIVVTTRSNTIDPKAVFSLDRPLENTDNLVDVGLNIAGNFLPVIAAWEGVLGLLFKRKRTHYVNAVKAVNPAIEGSVAFNEAFHSIGAALGIVHSTPETGVVFEEAQIKDAKAALRK